MNNSYPGFFWSIEGPDGVGKTTLLKALIERFGELNIPYLVTKEPGDIINDVPVGSDIGPALRQLLFHKPSTKNMAVGVADMLFLADHIQMLETVLKPALDQGLVVLCDRYVDSQFAYGPERNLPEWVYDAFAANFTLQPDMTVLLVADPQVALARAAARSGVEGTKQAGKTWADPKQMARIQKNYLDQIGNLSRTFVVDTTTKTLEEVLELAMGEFGRRMGQRKQKHMSATSSVIAIDQRRA